MDEDGNLREDVADKQSAERAVEEIQLHYNSFVNKNPLLKELSQKGKDIPSERLVCIFPAISESDDDFVILGGEENVDHIITDPMNNDSNSAYNTHQMELNETITDDKDNFYKVEEDIGVQVEISVDGNIIDISAFHSSNSVSPENDTIADTIQNYQAPMYRCTGVGQLSPSEKDN